MTYPEAVAWLHSFDDLERGSDPARWRTVKLERVERLMELLGRPHEHGRTVHLAGTKGKGSTAAMLEAVLRAAGYRTGLYTSPHLVSSRERIRVDGRPIGREEVARLVATRLRPAAERYLAAPEHGRLSWFDLHTALGFLQFQAAKVEWSVIEVGLGGRLDATNVVQPRVCAITPISLDHTDWLGDTVAAIAGEKAGILKPGVPVVLAKQPFEARGRILAEAAQRGAPVVLAHGVTVVPGAECVERAGGRMGQRVTVEWAGAAPREAMLGLLGAHQAGNAAVARTLAELLAAEAPAVTLDATVAGLEQVHWPGRLEVLGRRPWLVVDGAHNPASAARLAEALNLLAHHRRFMVMACHRDKDIAGVAANLCRDAAGVVATGIPNHPRAATADEVGAAAARHCDRVAVRPEPAAALALAREWAGPDDLIGVAGSLALVGAVLELERGPEPA